MTGHPMKICCFHIVCECDMEKEHISVFIVARNVSSFFVCVYHILFWIILDISKTDIQFPFFSSLLPEDIISEKKKKQNHTLK